MDERPPPGGLTSARMRVSIVPPSELGASELTAWRSMQQATPELDSPFLAPGFALAAERARSTTRIAVLEESGAIVGFFPFDQGRFRVARPVAPGVSDAQAVIHAPGFEWRARDLLAGCGIDGWEFDHLVGGQLGAVGPNVARHRSAVMDVSRGYDAYIDERRRSSKKIVKSTLYKQRKLDRDLGQSRFAFDAADRSALDHLMRWKSAQYRRTGRRDRFAVGWIRQLVLDLFETRSDGCSGVLSVLYAGGDVVAAHFGLRSGSRLSCWFPGYEMRFARYSPGLSLHLKMAEEGAAAGVRYLELGKGDEEYKMSLKSCDVMVGEGWADRPSAVAALCRARRASRRWTLEFVLSRPALRHAARRTLARVGSVRSLRGSA
jgi:CelD/BcsL family acetyltransferase involved in cellulose biosynthesis